VQPIGIAGEDVRQDLQRDEIDDFIATDLCAWASMVETA